MSAAMCRALGAEWSAVVIPTDPIPLPSVSQAPKAQPALKSWLHQLIGLDAKANAYATKETSVGASSSPHAISLYSTLTWAPFGPVTADGWRLRTSVSGAKYSYDSTFQLGTLKFAQRYRGLNASSDVMLGYQWTQGPATLKAFVGGVGDVNRTYPIDLSSSQGLSLGFKTTAEAWINLGPEGFVAINGAWATAHGLRSLDSRIGYRLTPDWSTGLEGGFAANEDSRSGRAGGFLRYEWSQGEVAVSGGQQRDDAGSGGTYITANFLVRN